MTRYFYYTLTSMGYRPKWNMILTTGQIIQMIVGTAISINDLVNTGCGDKFNSQMGTLMYETRTTRHQSHSLFVLIGTSATSSCLPTSSITCTSLRRRDKAVLLIARISLQLQQPSQPSLPLMELLLPLLMVLPLPLLTLLLWSVLRARRLSNQPYT